MKDIILLLIILFTISVAADSPKILQVDDFEDGNIIEEPAWWTFGDTEQVPVDTIIFKNSPLQKYLGKYALQVKGETKDWYIGGMGTYIGKKASSYTHIKLYVYGAGPKSGEINIQLYDDDNKNYKLEQDIENNYEPIFDDKFEYTINVIWKGWKVLIIPINKFKDVNKTVGDNIWNPDDEEGSGGLLHFQMIFLANSKTGPVDVAIDNIKFITLKQ